MMEWKEIKSVEDLPHENGEHIVVLHLIQDFFGEPDEKEKVVSAYFYYEQKIWEITPYVTLNALLPIYDLFDTCTTDYVSHWSEMPEPPKEV